MFVLAVLALSTGDACLNATDVRDGYNLQAVDISHGKADSASTCAARCCAEVQCVGWTFSSYQPHSTAQCAAGAKCCWLKSGRSTFVGKTNCTSGRRTDAPPPPPAPPVPPPSPFLAPRLAFVKTIANDSTGQLRDPSSVVQDPATSRWHFYVDYMPGSLEPGWHAFLHHYSAAEIEGPWTNHGIAPGLNHSADPQAWDYAGTFSPSLIYAPDEQLWYMFYSASGANQSALLTCAQMVARSASPGGPWEKLGLVGAPTGSDDGNWSKSWNARRLDSGRALVLGGQKAYWTKGVKDAGTAQEGVYLPRSGASFAPPYSEWSGNPVFPTSRFSGADSNGYENCEFWMGPPNEAGRARGLLHVLCNFHGGKGPPGLAQGPQPHFVSDPYNDTAQLNGGNWVYVGALSTAPAGEPTPVYEPQAGAPAGSVGIPGDNSSTRYFIARQKLADSRLTIGLYRLEMI